MSADPSGWMPGITQVRTNEYGYDDVAEDGMYPQAVVNHVMQGYQRTMLDWARNGNAGKSAHFTVGRDGHIVQHVSIWDCAYHAGDVAAPSAAIYPRYGGNPNRWTIGVEQEGFSVNPGYGYDYLYSDFQPWPDALIESVIAIHRFVFSAGDWLRDANDKPDRVLTHSQLNASTRPHDPGALWVKTVRPRILAALEGEPVEQPATTPAMSEYDRGWADGERVGFENGRLEVFDAWEGDINSYAEHVRTRREAWSIRKGA